MALAAATVTKRFITPIGGRTAVYFYGTTLGGTETKIETGLHNVEFARLYTASGDSTTGLYPNSNAGTEGDAQGWIYFDGATNGSAFFGYAVGT